MKVLSIVSSGYRATVEEQDDTVVWLSHCLCNAGGEVDVLLEGPAVNYAVEGQAVQPILLGGRAQAHGPDVHGQLRGLLDKGAAVYAVREDGEDRGVDARRMLQQVRLVSLQELPALLSRYDRVWHW